MTIIVFTPDGAGHCLYTEAIDLSLLGRLEINRATTIEYDNKAQCWRVRNRNGFTMYTELSREKCLDWERQHFNAHLEDLAHSRPKITPCDHNEMVETGNMTFPWKCAKCGYVYGPPDTVINA